MHHHYVGHAEDACDRHDVAEEIVIELAFEERRIDRARRAEQQERITSAGARTTASVPIVVDAPGRFSITNCWPRRSERHCPFRRAAMSVVPAGAKPTMMRTGRAG